MNYTLTRSKRKTIGIYITKDATVEVRAPLKMSKAEIDKFVGTKQKWIDEHLTARTMQNEKKAGFILNFGDRVWYCGKQYPIAAIQGNRVGFDGACFYMPDDLSGEEIKHAVIQIYKILAKQYLTGRATHYAKRMGLSPAAVKINSAKTHWGSCSGKNSINFTWRLVLADDKTIDYVVVHELAHIREHNHSGRFWSVVEGVLPDYKERQHGLKELQARLSGEDWG